MNRTFKKIEKFKKNFQNIELLNGEKVPNLIL